MIWQCYIMTWERYIVLWEFYIYLEMNTISAGTRASCTNYLVRVGLLYFVNGDAQLLIVFFKNLQALLVIHFCIEIIVIIILRQPGSLPGVAHTLHGIYCHAIDDLHRYKIGLLRQTVELLKQAV